MSPIGKADTLPTCPNLFFALDIERPCSTRPQDVAYMRVAPVASLVYVVGIDRILLPIFQLPNENHPLNTSIARRHMCTHAHTTLQTVPGRSGSLLRFGHHGGEGWTRGGE